MIRERLAKTLDGEVLAPGDPGYDTARAVWNAMVDRRPRLIARCHTVADVRAAVRAARDLNLEIGVRCGGHSVVGLGIPDDGLMIDLQYGLSCDNVVAFEMVTADGDVVRASQTENADLYWGLRGGGGNFGVVTEFAFRLHEVGTTARITELSFPIDAAGSVLRTWRDLSAEAPRQATFTAGLPSDQNVVAVGFVWVGHPAAGQAVPSMKALGRPLTERVVELSYVDLQRIDDTPQGHSLRRYWKGHYLRELSEDAIEALLQSRREPPGGGLPNIGLQAYGGAIAEVPEQDTAFAFRDTSFEYVAASRWTDPAEDDRRIALARRTAAALDAFAQGQYVNTLSDEGAAGVRRAYPPEKLARLTALKDKYDPQNVFHLNNNIRPSEPARRPQT